MKEAWGALIALIILIAVVAPAWSEKDAVDDPLGSLDAGIIKAMHLEYRINMAIPGREMGIDITRDIEEAKIGERPIWRIVNTSETLMGPAVDTFEIDARSLLPVSWKAEHGQLAITMNYYKNAVRGNIDSGSGSAQKVDVPLDKPVVGDGSAFETILPAIRLIKGRKTRIDMFDSDKQQVRAMTLEIVGEKTVTVPAGTFETVSVELKPVDEEYGGGTYFISIKEPRVLVRSVFTMPKEAGGGAVISELASYQ